MGAERNTKERIMRNPEPKTTADWILRPPASKVEHPSLIQHRVVDELNELIDSVQIEDEEEFALHRREWFSHVWHDEDTIHRYEIAVEFQKIPLYASSAEVKKDVMRHAYAANDNEQLDLFDDLG